MVDASAALDSEVADSETDSASWDVQDAADHVSEVIFETAYVDAMVVYGASRQVAVRLWYPLAFSGAAPVIVVSHGGSGNTIGHTRFVHLGTEFAAHGYLSVHVNHRPSSSALQHRFDRPADVSAVLDALAGGSLALPPEFAGTADLGRVGHTGHSWGAYTSHALGGAAFEQGAFRDERVDAIAPMSPQGWGGFGAFDDEHDLSQGSMRNSWMNVTVPSFNVVGGAEIDYQGEEFVATDWRLFPFVRYPNRGDKFVVVIPGQTHDDIGGSAEESVLAYIAHNLRAFFDVYLKRDSSRACDVGRLGVLAGTRFQVKFVPGSSLGSCD